MYQVLLFALLAFCSVSRGFARHSSSGTVTPSPTLPAPSPSSTCPPPAPPPSGVQCLSPYPGSPLDCGWLNFINCNETTTPSSNKRFPPKHCHGKVPEPWPTVGPLSFPSDLDTGYGHKMTPLQIYSILSLVWVAENGPGPFTGVVPWYNAYGYIQNIGDGRGYTTNIVGFCSGTGDLPVFLNKLRRLEPCNPLVQYLPDVRALSAANSPELTGLEGFAAKVVEQAGGPSGSGPINPNYIKATWNTLSDKSSDSGYWGRAMDASRKYHLGLPISKGQLYDIVLNSGNLSILKNVSAVVKPPTKKQSGGDQELRFLAELQNQWLKVITTSMSLDDGQPDRALMWQHLAFPNTTNVGTDGQPGANNTVPNLDLSLPLTVRCYSANYNIQAPSSD
ncbi:lysozyme-like domain-containing protein [Polychytrium aggregatum]|uniref:lysozyme-like domain-containing protein n=1 Tax=Polychytrium aggregatum TaxID=110093 RepID=UPI0022FE8DD4|nr:lysozyme-like domain-containing protein [Polychytrium aggregatum]KAI9208311.1 lysozyme-like domain-containing protein [Polychytrium aggregatum]